MNKSDSPSLPAPFTAPRVHMDFQTGLFVGAVFLSLFVSRTIVPIFFLFTLASATYFQFVEKDWNMRWKDEELPLFSAMLIFAAYLQINALWALDPSAGMGKALLFLLIVIICVGTLRVISLMAPQNLMASARTVLGASVICASLAAFEGVAGSPIKSWFFEYFPALREITDLVILYVKDGELSVSMVASRNNRNLTLLVLFMWPALLLAKALLNREKRYIAAAILAAATCIAVLPGDSQTALLAIVLSGAAFVGSRFSPGMTHKIIAVLWCMALLLAVPLSMLPHKLGLHKTEWIFSSARSRMVIWDYTANETLNNPLLGIGVRSTRQYHSVYNKPKIKQSGDKIARRTSLHAHNNFLQIWFELGGAGAVMVMAIGLFVLSRIKMLAKRTRPYAYGVFVAICAIASSGFGLWQAWLLTAYGFSAIFMGFAIRASGISISQPLKVLDKSA